jgi:D-glycerate 3-kinase
MNPIATLIAERVLQWRGAGVPLIVGIAGPQASGKSTATGQVADHLSNQGLRVGTLSLDDLYLSRAARTILAGTVHPLFATRGVPGTHDVAMGLDVLAKVRAGLPVLLPRFSKGYDEPLPMADWPRLDGCDVFLFEGWCIGARAQDAATLTHPVNALERDHDHEGLWRRAANAHLAGQTGALFSQIDRLVYLRPPSFSVVYDWRCAQEHELIAGGNAPAAMSDAHIAHFIAHYERLTCHMIAQMPGYVDLVIPLGPNHEVLL